MHILLAIEEIRQELALTIPTDYGYLQQFDRMIEDQYLAPPSPPKLPKRIGFRVDNRNRVDNRK
jgi:hypothetical protein